MKKIFNKLTEKDDGRTHHYVLLLSAHAGVDYRVNPKDVDKPPFAQATLFLARVKDWAEKRGESKNIKAEVLPVSRSNHPRLRIDCPPKLLAELQKEFPRKIAQVDEIPLPKVKKAWWNIFGI
ncbi:MAG: hypothetical protein ACAH80_11080 [Alphaproteobacteria bacterium]